MSGPIVGRALRSDWTGVLILTLVVLARGLCYLPALIPHGHRIPALERYLPLWSWSTLWLAAGVVGLVVIVCRARSWLPMATGVIVALHTLWGAMYIAAWASGASERGYITALSYLTVAAVATWAFGRGDPTRRGGKERWWP